jgi:hypothetical protein
VAQLAQLNVARLRNPLDHPDLAPFVEALDAVNAVADISPGFVWRLQEETGNATGLRPWGEEMIVNLSVWEDVESLRDYVYSGAHAAVLRQRRSFFEVMSSAFVVLWWVPDGHRPTLEEARDRLELLEADGPTPAAFTLRTSFPPPDSVGDGTAPGASGGA